MSREGRYKMRAVVRYFRAAPYDWATRPGTAAALRSARWTFLVLECGHVKRDPWEVYQNEKAVRVRAFYHHVGNATGYVEARRVRCSQCVTGKQHAGVPAPYHHGCKAFVLLDGRRVGYRGPLNILRVLAACENEAAARTLAKSINRKWRNKQHDAPRL